MTNIFKLRFREVDTEYYNNWLTFSAKQNKGTGFYLCYEPYGYFDPRPQINTNLTTILALILPFFSLYFLPISLILCFYSWGSIYLRLPFDTGKNNDSESATYGVMTYHVDSGFPTMLWFIGWKSFDFPWAYKFHKREVLHKDGWYTEKKGDNLWDKQKWEDKILTETYPYTYTLNSGEKQYTTAEIYQEKRTWKNWFGLGKMTRHCIEVEFKAEMGERAGSWKGGCLGTSHELKKGETALECLRRMENTIKFR